MSIDELAAELAAEPNLPDEPERDIVRHCHVRMKWNGGEWEWVVAPKPAISTYYIAKDVKPKHQRANAG